MLVCHCFGVTDREIVAAVRRGDEAMVAGTGCGGCRPLVDALVAAEQHTASSPRIRSLPVLSSSASAAYLPAGAVADKSG